MQKILVLRGGALGDFIVTLPALASLRRRWPSARIELAGNSSAAEIGRAENLIDVAHSQHSARWSALYGGGALPAEFERWLAEFDLVVSYWPDPEGELARRFPMRPGQSFLSAPAHPAIAPAAAHYCAPLHALGPGLATQDYFFPLAGGQEERKTPGRPRIAIHPGSGSPRKNWPRERWSELAGWLREKFSAELLFVLGEVEIQTFADAGAGAGAVESFARHGRVLRNLPLRTLVAEFAACGLFLGHDSGVSHLAAACGAPCVLLFGPTDPAMWAPPAPQVRVIRRGPELPAISLSDVQDAVTEVLADRG